MIRRGSATVFGALIGGAALLSAQQPAPQATQKAFRGGVDLVQISVVATDANGQLIHGLTKEDFSITERGDVRPIQGFVEVAIPRPPASPFPPTLAQDVSDNISAKSDRVVILLLDDSHFTRVTNDVKAMARRVVDGLGEGTSIGLITSSGYFGMEPTTDRARVLQVIDEFVNKVEAPSGRAGMVAQGATVIGHGGPFEDLTMMKTNQDVAHMLAGGGPARKAFVWISGGQSTLCPEPPEVRKYSAPSSEEHRCYEMLYEMQRANVSTYAIDPEQGRDRFLRGVSNATGGFAVGRNDLDAGIGGIIDDLNNYYLLGFAPPNPTDTSYRDIEVRVNRPGITLRYRNGYTASIPTNVNTPKNLSPTATLVAGVLPKTDLRMRFSATALAPPAKDGKVPVAATVEVRGETARLARPDGWLRDTLKFEILAVDLQHKKASTSRTETRDVSWLPQTAPNDEASYTITTELWLPPGTYQVRASGESRALRTSGSVYLVINVPDLRSAPVALGSLLLGYANGARVGAIATGDAQTLPFLPTLDREFAASDVIRLRCGVSRSKSVHDVAVTLDVVDATDRIVQSTAAHITATDPPQFDTALTLTGLAPGAYRVRITATAGGAHDMREIGLLVR